MVKEATAQSRSCSVPDILEEGSFDHFMLGALALSITPTQLQQLSPSALAYVGDAFFELYVRTALLLPSKRSQIYHRQVVAQVRAEKQVKHLRTLEQQFTDEEREILRRGRNASPKGPKRLDPGIYQQATSFETLIGYLYFTDPQRLIHLLSQLELTPLEESDLRNP